MSVEQTKVEKVERITEIAGYNPIEAGLSTLREIVKTANWDLDTTEGDKEARAFRKQCVTLRTTLGKASKDLKAPHQQALDALNADYTKLIDAIKAIEKPVDADIKAVEERKAREREAARVAELERVKEIEGRIESMRGLAEQMVGAPSNAIQSTIDKLAGVVVGDSYDEFADKAKAVQDSVIDRLKTMHASTLESEQAAEAVRLEREALNAQRAKDAEEKQALLAKFEAMEAKAQAEKEAAEQAAAEVQAKQDAEAAKLEQERAAIEAEKQRQEDERQAEIDRAEAAKHEAEAQAERDKQAKAEAAAEKARMKAEQKRLAELARAQKLASVGEAGYDLAVMVIDGKPADAIKAAAQAIIDTVTHQKD